MTRNAEMVRRVDEGRESYGSVARDYGISRERVRQIVERQRFLRRQRAMVYAARHLNRAEEVTVDNIIRHPGQWAAAGSALDAIADLR
jgi:transposase-like protein